jgi:hypothetical protein
MLAHLVGVVLTRARRDATVAELCDCLIDLAAAHRLQ